MGQGWCGGRRWTALLPPPHRLLCEEVKGLKRPGVSEQLLVTAARSAAQTFQMETLMKPLEQVLGSTATVACVWSWLCGQIIR